MRYTEAIDSLVAIVCVVDQAKKSLGKSSVTTYVAIQNTGYGASLKIEPLRAA